MKKITILSLLFLICLPTVLGSYQIDVDTVVKNQDFHPVFVEYATTTWCPQCPNASEALNNLYQTGQHPFYYVSLVSDVNPNAQLRTKEYHTIAIPTIYVDGGKSLFVGNSGSYQTLRDTYQDLIRTHANQPVHHDIIIETESNWLGNAQIQVNVTVTNNGTRAYFGKIRTYITEITSRWRDYHGNPYHYALLDFAFNEHLFLPQQSSKSFSTIWDGTMDHNGLTYEDITKENIMVISSIFHWIPHLRLGYVGFPYMQLFFAHYANTVDSTPLTS